MGARVTLVGAAAAAPARDRGARLRGLDRHRRDRDADVVYVLRMQQERMLEGANYVPSLREYTARWGVTPERLRPGQKVMHPGPMNRGVEIDPAVADAADALIETQVRAGLVVRMAVLYDLLTHGPVAVQRRRDRGGGLMLCRRRTLRGGPRRPRRARARSRRGRRRGARRPRSTAARSPRSAPRSSQRAPGGRGRQARARARRSSTRTSTCARPGREDEETIASGTARRGGGRLLRHPRDAEHRSGRRLGRRARRARRAARGARPRSRSASSPRSRRGRRAAS